MGGCGGLGSRPLWKSLSPIPHPSYFARLRTPPPSTHRGGRTTHRSHGNPAFRLVPPPLPPQVARPPPSRCLAATPWGTGLWGPSLPTHPSWKHALGRKGEGDCPPGMVDCGCASFRPGPTAFEVGVGPERRKWLPPTERDRRDSKGGWLRANRWVLILNIRFHTPFNLWHIFYFLLHLICGVCPQTQFSPKHPNACDNPNR